MCEFHKRIVDLMCAIKLDFRGNKCRSLHLQPLEVKVGSFKSVAKCKHGPHREKIKKN